VTAVLTIAAWVAGRPVTLAEIDERLAAMRDGPLGVRLPHPDTADGRNLRRWLVQAVTTEAVVAHEAARYGVEVAPEDEAAGTVTLRGALSVGGVAAAVLAGQPLARALRRHVAPEVPVPEDEAVGYHARNRDRYPQPYPEVRSSILAALSGADRDRRFARWLESRCADLVRLAPGFEHPADPRHPDATHRH
jgi:[acyl-carrier-protein] S-malonyltransferase